MRNMVTSILENGEVTCTLARAKEVRAPLEKMITFAKRGDLHARRQVLRFVKSKLAMENLFGEIAMAIRNVPRLLPCDQVGQAPVGRCFRNGSCAVGWK